MRTAKRDMPPLRLTMTFAIGLLSLPSIIASFPQKAIRIGDPSAFLRMRKYNVPAVDTKRVFAI